MALITTYSFRSLVGVIQLPYVGPLILSGGYVGLKTVTIGYATERTSTEIGSDGSVLVSALAGANGHIELEILQLSSAQSILLAWYNACVTAQLAGDVSLWAAGTAAIRSVTSGENFILSGISPGKPPDKVYSAQGQNIRWTLPAANVYSTTA